MSEIYLDNAATTRAHPEVAEEVRRALLADFGNPSSLHRKGHEAERLVKESRAWVADALGVAASEVVFTSGGTEGNNLAIQGVARARARRGRHLITTKIEHSSVLNACKALEEEGFRVTYLDVDAEGRVTPEQVAAALTDETILVTVMHVNNEIGTVQPIEEIAKAVKASRPDALVHSDGVQAFLKVPLSLSRTAVDLYTASAHKVHGPKGVGALYVRSGVRLKPIFGRGEQEGGLRSGTENVPGIAGFGEAVHRGMSAGRAARERMSQLRLRLARRLLSVEGAVVNGPLEHGAAPHILNLSFAGVRGEVLVHALEAKGVYVSTGSACSSRNSAPSHVLKALGRPDEAARESIRISLSWTTSEEEVDRAASIIEETIAELRTAIG